MVSLSSSLGRFLVTAGLLFVAFVLAWLGRWVLDELVATYPQWSAQVERFGGWALGMLIGLVVVLPVYRLYGVFPKKRHQKSAAP
jgi:hypothetical protein